MTKPPDPVTTDVGFLLIALGGSARSAMETLSLLFESDRRPFPKQLIYVDTEPGNPPAADLVIPIGLGPDDIAMILADPAAVGPVAEAVVRHYPQFLKPESSQNGSRTVRFNSQLALEYHLGRVVRDVNRSVRELKRTAGVGTVLPVLFSSTGGGAGGALVVLFGTLFANPDFRARVTEGLSPHTLAVPVALVTEPFSYALKHHPKHADKIMANAFAFRIETALIDPRDAFQYILHLGLANDGGAVLDTPEEICRVLGTAVYLLCREWPYYKARAVDTVDSAKAMDRYRGVDVPEYHIPPEDHPPYASTPGPRNLRRRISLVNGVSPHDS